MKVPPSPFIAFGTIVVEYLEEGGEVTLSPDRTYGHRAHKLAGALGVGIVCSTCTCVTVSYRVR